MNLPQLSITKKGEFIIKLNNFTIRGRSIGGCETCILIDELGVAFDAGYQADKLENMSNLFISHGHLDHIGCLQFCNAKRKLHHINNPWQIVMPKCYIEPYKILVTAASSMQRGGVTKPSQSSNMQELMASEDCIKQPLINKQNFYCTSYQMKHKITSYGYIVYEKRSKLKSEYSKLSSSEIKQLRENNVEITYELSIPTIAFTGDTTIEPILEHNDFLNAKILIMECTHFLDSSVIDAQQHGHVHFQQFLDHIDRFNNEWIILCHFSQKYRAFKDIEQYIKLIPEHMLRKIIFFI